MKKVIALLALFSVAVQAQNTFADPRDGKKYRTVKIGTQTWMAENLNYEAKGSKCYEDNSNYCTKYGRLYNWETAIKACPSGWHLPSHDEWTKLMLFLASNKKDVHYKRDSALGKELVIEYYENAGKYLKAKSGWEEYNFSPKKECKWTWCQNNPFLNSESSKTPKCKWTEEKIDEHGQVTVTEHDKCITSTDEYGFSALPGGYGYGDSGEYFGAIGREGHWWSASEYNSSIAYQRHMLNGNNLVGWNVFSPEKSHLYSVRCLKD
jgi:uncharacterized protein (TIGR02145 family)